MFYSGKLTHMILHDDSKWPYSTLEDVWKQYHDRYEGHCIVINAHWHDPGPRYCGDYKVQGKILSNQYPNTLYGFKWNTGDVPVGMDTGMGEYENFLSTIPALINGERQNLSYGTGVERAAARTWIGYGDDGEWSVEATEQNELYTLDGIVDRMEELGVTTGMVLDGGGSSQWYDGTNTIDGDGRTIFSFLILWFEEEKEEPLDWETEKKLAREWVMEMGISDGERGGDSIKREELWVMLYRMGKNGMIG